MALNTKDILDQALGYIQDNTTEMRTKFTTWMNQVMQSVVTKPWSFFETTASVDIINSTITLPEDYREFISLQIGDMYFLSKNDLCSDEDVWLAGGDILLPGLVAPVETGTATLKYKKSLTTYADNEATVFPDNFINLFIRGILSKYYEWDADERVTLAIQMYNQELAELRKEVNQAAPRPKRNRHGYLRERQ